MNQRDVLLLLRVKQRIWNVRHTLKEKVMVAKCIISLEIDTKETA